MADKSAAETAPAPEAAKSSKGGTLKTLIMLVAVLALEGGTIGVTMMMVGGPREVQGVSLEVDQMADQNKVVEVLVVKDKFENLKTGRQFLYDTEVYITVRKRDETAVTNALAAQKAQIAMAIGTVVRQSDPAFLQEATYATLRRQIKAKLDEMFDKDPDGQSIVQEVLVTRCIPFRGDF
jgi:flagellar basal body-associated protein FliL